MEDMPEGPGPSTQGAGTLSGGRDVAPVVSFLLGPLSSCLRDPVLCQRFEHVGVAVLPRGQSASRFSASSNSPSGPKVRLGPNREVQVRVRVRGYG